MMMRWKLLPGFDEAIATAVNWGYPNTWAANRHNALSLQLYDPNGDCYNNHYQASQAAGMCVSNVREDIFFEALECANGSKFPRGWTMYKDGRIYDPEGNKYTNVTKAAEKAVIFDCEYLVAQWRLICDYISNAKANEALTSFGRATYGSSYKGVGDTVMSRYLLGTRLPCFEWKKVPHGMIQTEFVSLETEECREQFVLAINSLSQNQKFSGLNLDVIDELMAKMAVFKSEYFRAKELGIELPGPPLRNLVSLPLLFKLHIM